MNAFPTNTHTHTHTHRSRQKLKHCTLSHYITLFCPFVIFVLEQVQGNIVAKDYTIFCVSIKNPAHVLQYSLQRRRFLECLLSVLFELISIPTWDKMMISPHQRIFQRLNCLFKKMKFQACCLISSNSLALENKETAIKHNKTMATKKQMVSQVQKNHPPFVDVEVYRQEDRSSLRRDIYQ